MLFYQSLLHLGGILGLRSTSSPSFQSLSLDDKVDLILSSGPGLIDGHNDLPIFTRAFYNNILYQSSYDLNNISFPGHINIPKLQHGRLSGQFWSLFVACPATNESESSPVLKTFEQLDVTERIFALYPEVFRPVSYTYEYARIPGKVNSMLGIEGLHQIGGSVAVLRQLYRDGVRYATLTHTCSNVFADSANDKPLHNGLSKVGVKVIHEMNRLGMIVDLAHVSWDTMRQAIKTSKAPVIFSHSAAAGLCNITRNVPDDVLELLPEKDGVIMVNFYNNFVVCKDPESATLKDVADHVEYIANITGWDHVGIGADYDGIENTPKGLEGVDKYPDLFKELLRRGNDEKDLVKLAGLNLMRVWKLVEDTSIQLQNKKALPFEQKAYGF